MNKDFGDKFNRETGMSIAVARAAVWPTRANEIPRTVQPYFARIADRAKKYFKNCEFA